MIEVDLNAGGSGRGISYYSSAMRCPRKLRLNAETSKPVDRSNFFKSDAGTIFHAYAANYHTGVDPYDIHIIGEGYEMAESWAKTMFKGYVRYIGAGFWGKPIGAEITIGKDEKEAEKIKEALGVVLTARLDLVTIVDTERAKRLTEHVQRIVEPGNYIVDHKTTGRLEKPEAMQSHFGLSMQFTAYPYVWNLLHPDKPVKGMFVNGIKRHIKQTTQYNESHFGAVLIDTPIESDVEALKAFLGNAAALAESDACFATNCFTFNKPCFFYSRGDCTRS